MVRREEVDRSSFISRRSFPAGASPVSVSAGAPSSRSRALAQCSRSCVGFAGPRRDITGSRIRDQGSPPAAPRPVQPTARPGRTAAVRAACPPARIPASPARVSRQRLRRRERIRLPHVVEPRRVKEDVAERRLANAAVAPRGGRVEIVQHDRRLGQPHGLPDFGHLHFGLRRREPTNVREPAVLHARVNVLIALETMLQCGKELSSRSVERGVRIERSKHVVERIAANGLRS